MSEPAPLPDDAYVLPRELTPAVQQVLRLMPWETRDVARVLEKAGRSVPRKCEDEQAHAMFFLLPYAIAFGDDWWIHAHAALVAMNPKEGAPSEG